ncbi:MAG TPA: hypothetical protein VMT70_20105 [Vicinamibacteria bacterium]|nr:hypothetical protein [Vicinamibacteria bacterium]
MARGFESKSVADQQEGDRLTSSGREEPTLDPVRLARKRRLELSRADVLTRLAAARAGAHREMLERALRALEEEIASLR